MKTDHDFKNMRTTKPILQVIIPLFLVSVCGGRGGVGGGYNEIHVQPS